MIEFFAAISIGGACLSCFCAYQTWRMCGAIRDIEDRRIRNMSSEQPPDEYQDLSTGPRYREYGDLS